MNRGSAGIVLIMLAVLGVYLYLKTDIIGRILKGTGPVSGAGGGGSSGAQNATINAADSGGYSQPLYSTGTGGCVGCGGGGLTNVGELGTPYGLGIPAPAGYPTGAKITPLGPTEYIDYRNPTDPVHIPGLGAVDMSNGFVLHV